MLSIYVSKHLRVKSEVGLVVLDARAAPGTPYGFACAGGGLSPALCEYNEQAATVRTPARDKNIDAPDTIRAAR